MHSMMGASIVPEWLKAIVNQDWFDRYAARFEQYRLPKEKAAQEELALTIGADGHQILSAIEQYQNSTELRQLSSIEILRQVWVQQYTFISEELVWRQPKTTGMPAHKFLIQSPYDESARNRTKRDTNWTGYTVHITETCDQNSPNLITNVETTLATTPDGAITQQIHASLAEKDLLPSTHLLDTAYVDAEHLVNSRSDYQIELLGKLPPDTSWQAQEKVGFDLSCFTIDWSQQKVTCPLGQVSQSWRSRTDDYNNQVIEVRFDRVKCNNCEMRRLCTRAKTEPRLLKFRPQLQHQALQAARQYQRTTEFQIEYAKRAGIEGTISQGCRAFGLRSSRYIGLAKTHLQHIATATAINLHRLMAYFQQVPLAKRRISPFVALGNIV